MNYYHKFIDFFQRQNLYNKKMFDYFMNNSILFDYRDEDYHPFIGCFYLTKNKKINKISLVVPYIDSDVTTLINIHEYTHAIILYNHLGKIYEEDISSEALPMFYERLYFEENKDNESLRKHINKLNTKILEGQNPKVLKYRLASDIQNELLNYYNKGHTSLHELNRKVKRLTKNT